MTWKVFMEYDLYRDATAVAVRYVERDGSRVYAEPLALKPYKLGELLPPVGLTGDLDGEAFMQAMLNAAWEYGLRPTGFKDHTNELTAVRYHLEDMRTLAKVKPKNGGAG